MVSKFIIQLAMMHRGLTWG